MFATRASAEAGGRYRCRGPLLRGNGFTGVAAAGGGYCGDDYRRGSHGRCRGRSPLGTGFGVT